MSELGNPTWSGVLVGAVLIGSEWTAITIRSGESLVELPIPADHPLPPLGTTVTLTLSVPAEVSA